LHNAVRSQNQDKTEVIAYAHTITVDKVPCGSAWPAETKCYKAMLVQNPTFSNADPEVEQHPTALVNLITKAVNAGIMQCNRVKGTNPF